MPELFIPEMKDIPACAQTYVSAYSVPPWNEAYDGEDIEKYIAEYLMSDTFCCYALRNGKEIIGIALGLIVPSLAVPYLRIEDFCIRADWQGKGMGSLLMKLLAEKARERGCDSVMLGTQRDYPSHRFYLKNDFVEIESVLLYRVL